MRIELLIEDLAQGGEGIARHGGRMVFVPFTAPGDRVLAEVPKGEGTTAHGELLEVLEAGPARRSPPCRHFGVCGGCEWLCLSYEAQLRAKERSLKAVLRRIARIEPEQCGFRPIVPSPSPLRYRTRAKFHFDRNAGRLVFFRRRSHEPVVLAECHLLVQGLDALREALGEALKEARFPACEVALEWSEVEKKGAAHLRLPEAGPGIRARAEGLLGRVPGLAGALVGGETGTPWILGEPVLRQPRDPGVEGAGLQRSRPDVFQQANRGANARLVEAALDLLRPEGEEVLELFCGAGNFTGPLAGRALRVSAVEVQGPALELARADEAERRGPGEVRFFAGDALPLSLALARERGPGARRFGAVLLDPPREGAKGIGPALRALSAPRAVYVSCDPATLARDVRACLEVGYRVEAILPLDMFPQTHHVEAAVLLERS